jgi:SAM-dependent methyltransferase
METRLVIHSVAGQTVAERQIRVTLCRPRSVSRGALAGVLVPSDTSGPLRLSAVNRSYWRGAAEDEVMQDEHGFVWNSMLDSIDTDLAGQRVLDVGCNRGGFLRLLLNRCAIGEGYGYDPAAGAIKDARKLAGTRPLHFEVSETVPAGWCDFDAAFSHEVLYLLHDLPSHASAVFAALSLGASYYAVMGVHARSPLMAKWHSANATALHLPELYDIDAVAAVFQGAGFEVATARLPVRFIPASGHHSNASAAHQKGMGLLDWLDYYYEDKLLLRFTRPIG